MMQILVIVVTVISVHICIIFVEKNLLL